MNHRSACNCDQCLLTQMRSANPMDRQRGWEAWYLRDAHTLMAFIERRCQALHCPTFSEDILHDCFVLAFKNISGGRYTEQGRPLRAYLYGIAKNLIYEVVRLRRKELSDALQEDLQATEDIQTPREWRGRWRRRGLQEGIQITEDIQIDDRLYLKEVLTLVKEAHDQQPLLYQQIVNGIYAEGKSSDEVAVELHKTSGNIRAIARRAVQKIIQYLAHQHHIQLTSRAIRACLEML